MLATLLIYSGVTPVGNCNGTPASIEGVDERVGSTVFFAIKPKYRQMANIILSKESSNNELKSYFEAVLKLSYSDNEFPINLEDVWMIAYSEKSKAVRALKSNFIEGIDYITFAQNGQTATGGYKVVNYMLSIPCLEFFIARKVRPVFEVYRQVFHKAAKEPIFRESEIKKYLVVADKAIEKLTKRNKELEERIKNQSNNKELEERCKQLRAHVDTLSELYSEKISNEANMLSFIAMHGLKAEWDICWKQI